MNMNRVVVLPPLWKFFLTIIFAYSVIYSALLMVGPEVVPSQAVATGSPQKLHMPEANGLQKNSFRSVWFPSREEIKEGNAILFVWMAAGFFAFLAVAFLDPGKWRLAYFQKKFMLKTFPEYSGLKPKVESSLVNCFLYYWFVSSFFVSKFILGKNSDLADVYFSGRCWYELDDSFYGARRDKFGFGEGGEVAFLLGVSIKLELNFDVVTVVVRGPENFIAELCGFGDDTLVGAVKNGEYVLDAVESGEVLRRWYNDRENGCAFVIMRKKLNCDDFMTNYIAQVKFSRDIRYFTEGLIRLGCRCGLCKRKDRD